MLWSIMLFGLFKNIIECVSDSSSAFWRIQYGWDNIFEKFKQLRWSSPTLVLKRINGRCKYNLILS